MHLNESEFNWLKMKKVKRYEFYIEIISNFASFIIF